MSPGLPCIILLHRACFYKPGPQLFLECTAASKEPAGRDATASHLLVQLVTKGNVALF